MHAHGVQRSGMKETDLNAYIISVDFEVLESDSSFLTEASLVEYTMINTLGLKMEL